jgi:hypothetical protein
MMRRSVALTHV